MMEYSFFKEPIELKGVFLIVKKSNKNNLLVIFHSVCG